MLSNRAPVISPAVLPALAIVLFSAFLTSCGGRAETDPTPPREQPPAPVAFRVEEFLTGANFPVKMLFAPDGRLFYNELRTGQVRIVENGSLVATPFVTLPVKTDCECGVLGLALDPQFATNRFVYVYHSHPDSKHRLLRFREQNGIGVEQTVILDNLPLAGIHNAGRIGFGQDGHLYIAIGDLNDPATAQNESARGGKLHRFRKDGGIPADNPFGANNSAFAMGLRNSFGLTFHPQTGTPYLSDNGPQCDDRVVRVVPGGNYGWRPGYQCGETDARFIQPIARWGAERTAPTGITFYTGTRFPQFQNGLLVAEFNTGRLRHLTVNEAAQGNVTAEEIVTTRAGERLLDVTQGPDGNIYFSSTGAIYRIVPQ